MLEQIKPTTLTAYVGSQFEVLENLPNPLSITLTNIVEHAKTERQEVFSLFFHGPSDIYLEQRTYRLKHQEFGELEIFLVPVGKDKDGFEYESVFNNLI